MNIDVHLPIRTYLKKFIAKTHDVDPFIISTGSKCWFSSIILQKMEKTSLPDIKEVKDINDFLVVRLPSAVITEKKFTITERTVLHIDGNLHKLFNDAMEGFITMSRTYKGDIFNYIPKFMEYYGITEDDIKFETLVKRYYRARLPEVEKMPRDMDLDGIQPELFG